MDVATGIAVAAALAGLSLAAAGAGIVSVLRACSCPVCRGAGTTDAATVCWVCGGGGALRVPDAPPDRWPDPAPPPDRGTITIRVAAHADGDALARLAVLNEERALAGEAFVAEVDGEVVAAIEIGAGRVLSDPFRPTQVVRRLLELRRRELASSRR